MKYGDEYPKKYDRSSVKLVACAGEVLNPPAWEWLQKTVFEDQNSRHRPYVADRDEWSASRKPIRNLTASDQTWISDNSASGSGRFDR